MAAAAFVGKQAVQTYIKFSSGSLFRSSKSFYRVSHDTLRQVACMLGCDLCYGTPCRTLRHALFGPLAPFTACTAQGGFQPEMNKREAALILGLRESAGEERIKEAHRRIMVANHPDSGRGAVAHRMPSVAGSGFVRNMHNFQKVCRAAKRWWVALFESAG